MAYTLHQLSDIEDIKLVKHRYFRGIDTADMELLGTLFTNDIEVDYRGGNYRAQLTGRADMMIFLVNSFHSGALAMHHGHMPEITLTGDDTAEGIWYLEDIFINLEYKSHTFGSAIYKDEYRRDAGTWKISRTEYDRVIEVILPLDPNAQITAHHLGKVGLKPDQREDIMRMISWEG